MLDPVVMHRRHLHAIPELDNELPETLRYVEGVLSTLGGVLEKPVKGALTLFLDFGREETLAFRADMDALPVTEKTEVDFASRHEGCMHACGHDGHMAMALRAAELAAQARDRGERFPRNLLFVFQPAEETTGGAQPICETGLFKRYRVTRIVGMHLWPKLPKGRIFSCPGPMMARSNEVWLSVEGKSVHISKHREGIDAMRAGMRWLGEAYAYEESLPPEALRTMCFGVFKAGVVQNAVAGSALLGGSLRTYSDAVAEDIMASLKAIARRVEEESGATLSLRFGSGYPAVWNHEELYEKILSGMGGGIERLTEPVLAAEDFSYYQREIPGVFFFLGLGETAELHSPHFCWSDEEVLPIGVDFWMRMARLA